MKWAELALDVEPAAVEPVSALFERAGCTGIAVSGLQSTERGAEWVESPAAPPYCTVAGYLTLPADVEAVKASLEEGSALLQSLGFALYPPVRAADLDEEDWAEGWKQYYKPLRVGRRLLICPTWEEPPADDGALVIRLDPGMAFGTGLHPTTQLCLELLESHVTPGCSMLDWGCGSGILSIAGLLLGAREVLLLDTDSAAVEVARENLRLNSLDDRAVCRTGSIEELTTESLRLDLLVGNIVAGPIARAAGCFPLVLRPGGIALFSGIIDFRLPEVTEPLAAAGMELVSILERGEWRALVYRSPGAA